MTQHISTTISIINYERLCVTLVIMLYMVMYVFMIVHVNNVIPLTIRMKITATIANII